MILSTNCSSLNISKMRRIATLKLLNRVKILSLIFFSSSRYDRTFDLNQC